MNSDIQRKINELALEAGRAKQSALTKFVHTHYTAEGDEARDTIPSYENFLFVLSLLKSRKTEYITEAKELLEKLFYYEQNGNFPVYLHETPCCYDSFMGLKIAGILFRIYEQFQQILGDSLRTKSISCLSNICQKALDLWQQREIIEYGIKVQMASSLIAVGRRLGVTSFENAGVAIMEDLVKIGPHISWMSREGIGNILTSLQLIYKNISESPWNAFWAHLEKTWHPHLKVYSGPAFKETQRGFFPDVVLYDYFLSSFSEIWPSRLLENHFELLHACLIQPDEGLLKSYENGESSGVIEDYQWFTKASEKYTYSFILNGDKKEKGFRSFSLQWEDEGKLYSLVCEGGRFSKMNYALTDGGIDLFFVLEEPMKSDHPLENREILFYCTAHDTLKIGIENVAATTFKLGETISIMAEAKIELKFDQIEGSAGFIGHVMPGNRPSQRLLCKRHFIHGYDRQIFLRTLRKEERSIIRVSLKI